jgi:uncharacterized protein (TIGR04141 family)
VAKKDKKQHGRRTTIYRLTGLEDLSDAIRAKYLEQDEFAVAEVAVGDQAALLVTGAMTRERAEWCAEVSVLTGEDIVITGSTPAGVLLLRPSADAVEANTAYALTYGMGFQLLEPGFLDNLFGQRIAIRTAEPDKLRSVTVTTMDERSRTSRATIPQGDGLMGFGLGDVGEAVSRVVAIANLPNLSRSDGKPLQLRGADALNVPVGRTADEILADLGILEDLLATDPPEELKILEQLTAVKNPKTKEALDGRLSEVLDGAYGTIGLAWPHERIDENGTPDSWVPGNLWPRRQNTPRQGQPEWDDIVEALEKAPLGGMRLDRVDRATIQLCRDAEGKDPISQAIPLRRWIAFQTDLNGRTYALYDGSWFQIHHEYASNINARTAAIFARPVDDIEFPAWEAADDEEAYNQKLAEAVGGVCLDRKLIKTQLHRRGIEACDVYLPDGTLIHVKRTEKSSAASHLIAQALVSADALCNDAEAREAVRERINAAGGDASALGTRPKRVILAAHRRDAPDVTADDLFTFTKVNLVRQATALEERSVPVRIVSVAAAE